MLSVDQQYFISEKGRQGRDCPCLTVQWWLHCASQIWQLECKWLHIIFTQGKAWIMSVSQSTYMLSCACWNDDEHPGIFPSPCQVLVSKAPWKNVHHAKFSFVIVLESKTSLCPGWWSDWTSASSCNPSISMILKEKFAPVKRILKSYLRWWIITCLGGFRDTQPKTFLVLLLVRWAAATLASLDAEQICHASHAWQEVFERMILSLPSRGIACNSQS